MSQKTSESICFKIIEQYERIGSIITTKQSTAKGDLVDCPSKITEILLTKTSVKIRADVMFPDGSIKNLNIASEELK